MNKKKWFLLVIVVLLIIGYVKLFYKTYSTAYVAKSADCIVALDVKRITNTIIWNTITTPSEWKLGNIFRRRKKKNWKDMVEVPDYVLAFHIKDQPAGIWFVVLDIKDEDDFQDGIAQYHFQKTATNEYANAQLRVRLLKNNGRLLVGIGNTKDTQYFARAADELFVRKTFIAKETLASVIATNSHLAMQINANSVLQKNAFVTANFNKENILIKGSFTPATAINFKEADFSYAESSLYTLAFTQPPQAMSALVNDSTSNKLSKAFNLDVDSFFIHTNRTYQFDFSEIRSRVDSAISYTYDDDFNQVEKVVVNNVREPAFNFRIVGDSVNNVYKYLEQSSKLEKTNLGNLFIAMPLVKSYCTIKSDTEMYITAANYLPVKTDKTIRCIFFQQLLFSQLPEDVQKYFPDNFRKAIENLDKMEMKAIKENEHIDFEWIILKKKNNQPIFKM